MYNDNVNLETISKYTELSVLEIEKDNPYALIGLGHLHYDFKDYREALNYWTRSYHLNETNADIRILTAIGNCHRKLRTFKDGVYYCLVNAIGADGIKYSYKRDVNVLRGYTERTNMQ